MSPEEQRSFDDLLDLFAMPGWRSLMDEFSDLVEQLDSVENISTLETLHKAKGKIEALNMFLKYETAIRFTLSEIENDETDS